MTPTFNIMVSYVAKPIENEYNGMSTLKTIVQYPENQITAEEERKVQFKVEAPTGTTNYKTGESNLLFKSLYWIIESAGLEEIQ